MQYTEKFQLGLWEPSDQVLHQSFNENTEKIETELAALAESVTATATTIATSMPRLAIGTYKGTGKCGSSYANKLTFPFKPKFLMVWGYSGYYFCAVEGQNLVIYSGGESGTAYTMTNTVWGNNYVSWYYNYPNGDWFGIGQMNDSNTTYQYIAIG